MQSLHFFKFTIINLVLAPEKVCSLIANRAGGKKRLTSTKSNVKNYPKSAFAKRLLGSVLVGACTFFLLL